MTIAPRRILLVIPSMRLAGGAERVVANLSVLLRGLGHKVTIASFDDDVADWHFQGDGERIALGQTRRLPLPIRWAEYAVQARKLAMLKRRFQADITISNLWRADLINLLSGRIGARVALAHINVAGNPTNRLMMRLRGFVSAVYQRFDRIVAVTRPLADELTALYRLKRGQCIAIDNFTFSPQATPCLNETGLHRAVWCGRLVEEKNLAGLLEVWSAVCAKLGDVQLVVLGDGPLRGRLEAQADRLGLRRGQDPADEAAQVVFVGEVARPADYQIGARVFLLSSLSEGLPMVLLEALSLGVPIIAADCPAGGVRAALSDDAGEATGFGALLPIPRPGDPASQALWTSWIVRALTDDAQRDRWHEAALVRAERFSPQVAGDKWNSLIEELTW